MSRVTLDVIGVLGFDYDFLCGENPDAELIRSSWERQITIGMTLPGFAATQILRAVPWITEGLFKFTSAQGSTKLSVKEKVGTALFERRKTEGRQERFDLLDGLMSKANLGDPAEVDELMDQVSLPASCTATLSNTHSGD